jgi:glucose/arabinose dehydrogenase
MLFLSLLSLLAVAVTGQPVVIPPNFSVAFIGAVGDECVKMALAPDGRIFLTEKIGRIWILEDGVKLDPPFLDMTATTSSISERGFYSMVIDPDFVNNGFVYLVYPTTINLTHDVVSRFTSDGTFDSEFFIHEFEELDSGVHLGSAMELGPDGMLYITHGDTAVKYRQGLGETRDFK